MPASPGGSDFKIEFDIQSVAQLCTYLSACLNEPSAKKFGSCGSSNGSSNGLRGRSTSTLSLSTGRVVRSSSRNKHGTMNLSSSCNSGGSSSSSSNSSGGSSGGSGCGNGSGGGGSSNSGEEKSSDKQSLSSVLDKINSFCTPVCLVGDPTLDPDDRVALACRCEISLDCPVLTLRSLSASSVLLDVLRPAFLSEDSEERVLACRLAWRMYHISQICGPRCKIISSQLSPVRSWSTFWDPCIQLMCTRVSVAVSEAVFCCFLLLLVDDTSSKLNVLLNFRKQNVANPIWIPYCFEALRYTSKAFQLKGLRTLCDVMFSETSACFPGHDVIICPRRESAVLQFLSDFTIPEILGSEIEMLCARHIAAMLIVPFDFWSGSSFSCNVRHTFTVLNSFGPQQNSSYRRVHFARSVLFEFFLFIKQRQDEIIIGHLRWINFLQFINFVISFVMFHGYANSKSRDHFPQPEELSLLGSFLPAPDSLKDPWSDLAITEPWKSTLSGPVVVHATAQPKPHTASVEGEEAYDLVLEDGMLLRGVMDLAINIGIHNHVESDIVYSATRDCPTRGRLVSGRVPDQDPVVAEYFKVMELLQAVLQVFNAAGYPLGRDPNRPAPGQLKSIKLDHASAVRSRSLPLLAPIVAGLSAVAKEHKKTLEYLVSVCNPPKADLIAHAVLMEGPMKRSQGLKSKNQGTGWMQLTSDSLRCMLGGSSHTLHKDYAKEAKLPREGAPRPKERKLHVIPLASIKSVLPVENAEGLGGPSFLVAGEAETFLLAPQGDSRNEWVNLLCAATARTRLKFKGEGCCLQGLHVFPSAAALAGRGLRPRSAVWPYDRLMMALGPAAESEIELPTDAAPLYTDQACCTTCRHRFTLVTRRHHCRNCGCVFCGPCSQRTFCLKDASVRVCDPCFTELSAHAAENGTEEKCNLCAVTFTFTLRRHHCRVCKSAVCNSCSKSRVKEDGKKKRVCLTCFRTMSQAGNATDELFPLPTHSTSQAVPIVSRSSPTTTPSSSPPSTPPPSP